MGCHSEVLGMSSLHRPSCGMIAPLHAFVKKVCESMATAAQAIMRWQSVLVDHWRDIRGRPQVTFKPFCVRPYSPWKMICLCEKVLRL